MARRSTPPVPTGNPWVPTPHDPATVPVPLPIVIVSVEGPYTERDRKLWTFLLHTVWHDLENQILHEISVKEVNEIFRELGGQHDINWIWESARRLTKTTIEWVRVEGDERYIGISSLFGAETNSIAQKQGVLRFNFPPLLIPILKDPRRFARLRIHFMIQLSGKYAVTLYELLESVVNKETPVLKASVDELRRWLKVPDGKMLRWPDLRRFAIEPAIKQINSDPHGAGFKVHMRTRKQGRATKWVELEVLKTEEREAIDVKLQERDHQMGLFDVRLKSGTFTRAKTYASGWDIYALEADWREWGKEQKDWPPTNPDGAFINFCKQRGPYPRG